MKPVRNLLLFIMVSLLTGACTSLQPVTQQVPLHEKARIEIPPRYVLDIHDAADDVKMVLAALVSRMKSDSESINGVAFDTNGDNRIRKTGFLNQGFALNVIDITGYQAEPVSGEKANALIEGYFQFRDIIGRMASFYFFASYSQTSEIITIHSSTAISLPSVSPVLETYFVPKSAFNELPLEEFISFTDLYLFVLMHSVPMKPDAVPNGPDDYYILVFCMSLISDQAFLEMTVNRTRGQGGKHLSSPVSFSGDSWRVLISGHHFDPYADAEQDVFYINVTYNSDPASNTRPVLIGSFANRKNTGLERPRSLNVRVVTREQEVIMPEDTGLGPLESGYIFLDPSRRADAAEIQTQLFLLGYYKMKVDGLFGKGSRSALKKFRKDYQLGEDDHWDIETQKTLFRNSGK